MDSYSLSAGFSDGCLASCLADCLSVSRGDRAGRARAESRQPRRAEGACEAVPARSDVLSTPAN